MESVAQRIAEAPSEVREPRAAVAPPFSDSESWTDPMDKAAFQGPAGRFVHLVELRPVRAADRGRLALGGPAGPPQRLAVARRLAGDRGALRRAPALGVRAPRRGRGGRLRGSLGAAAVDRGGRRPLPRDGARRLRGVCLAGAIAGALVAGPVVARRAAARPGSWLAYPGWSPRGLPTTIESDPQDRYENLSEVPKDT